MGPLAVGRFGGFLQSVSRGGDSAGLGFCRSGLVEYVARWWRAMDWPAVLGDRFVAGFAGVVDRDPVGFCVGGQ